MGTAGAGGTAAVTLLCGSYQPMCESYLQMCVGPTYRCVWVIGGWWPSCRASSGFSMGIIRVRHGAAGPH